MTTMRAPSQRGWWVTDTALTLPQSLSPPTGTAAPQFCSTAPTALLCCLFSILTAAITVWLCPTTVPAICTSCWLPQGWRTFISKAAGQYLQLNTQGHWIHPPLLPSSSRVGREGSCTYSFPLHQPESTTLLCKASSDLPCIWCRHNSASSAHSLGKEDKVLPTPVHRLPGLTLLSYSNKAGISC